VKDLTAAGVRVFVPEIADYEVRRKLIHIKASAGMTKIHTELRRAISAFERPAFPHECSNMCQDLEPEADLRIESALSFESDRVPGFVPRGLSLFRYRQRRKYGQSSTRQRTS
jgi:hypothetical protein